MSLSINDLIKGVSTAKNIATKIESVLHNPDIPSSKDFDDLKEIKDMAYSALKLGTQPRNGSNYMLPRTNFDDDPRKDSFMTEGAIDPNVIRKKINPDSAFPTLEGSAYTLFSLEPSNVKAHDFVNLIQKAHESYSNYKNRFALPPQTVPEALSKLPDLASDHLTYLATGKQDPKYPIDIQYGERNGGLDIPLDVNTGDSYRSGDAVANDIKEANDTFKSFGVTPWTAIRPVVHSKQGEYQNVYGGF